MQFISSIAVPTLLVAALDDPFIPAQVMLQAQSIALTNPMVSFELTARGGHVGWIEGTIWPANYYMEALAMDYLAS